MNKLKSKTQVKLYQGILPTVLLATMGSFYAEKAEAAGNVSFRLGVPSVELSLEPDSSLFPSVSLQNEAEVGDYVAVDVGVIGLNFSLFKLDTSLNDVSVEGGIFDTSAVFDNIDSATVDGTGVIVGYGTQFDINPLYLSLGAGVGGGSFDLDIKSDYDDFSESELLLVWQLRGGVGFNLTDNFGISADYRYMRSPDIGVSLDGQQGDAGFRNSVFTAGIDFNF